MIFHYVPSFTHHDWIDNQDRVQAGGEDGFNIRFHRLETEFRTLADHHLNPLIDTLSSPVTHLSLIPVLEPNRPDLPEARWELTNDVAQKRATQTEAHGVMNVMLPQGADIKSLLVTGAVVPGPSAVDADTPTPAATVVPVVTLFRKDISGNTGAEALITVDGFSLATPNTPTSVDNTRFKYFIEAHILSAGAKDSVRLFCFQLTYQ